MHDDRIAVAHHGRRESGDLPLGLDRKVAVLVVGPGIGDTGLGSAIERRDAAIDLPCFAGFVDPIDVTPDRRG